MLMRMQRQRLIRVVNMLLAYFGEKSSLQFCKKIVSHDKHHVPRFSIIAYIFESNYVWNIKIHLAKEIEWQRIIKSLNWWQLEEVEPRSHTEESIKLYFTILN